VGVVVGSQFPRIDVTPLHVTTRGDDAVDLAAVAGLMLDPWQEYVLRGACATDDLGKWAAKNVGLIVPRQNGKGSVLEARELAGLFLFGENIVHTAHLFGTAAEHQRRMESLIRGCDYLAEMMEGYRGDPRGKMSGIKTGNSEMSFTVAADKPSGRAETRMLFKARSKDSIRGYTFDLLVFDEAYNLPGEVEAAARPALSAKTVRGNPQVWYTSSAGFPDSDVLARVRDRAMSGDPGDLAFYEWSAPDGADPADPAVWAMANPALGRRISAEWVADERRTMGAEEFNRERLGIWSKVGGESAIPADFWEQCRDEDSEAGLDVAFGVDVTPLADVTSIASASWRDDGTVHIEIVNHEGGTGWVPGRVAELQNAWSPVTVAYAAGGQAGRVLGGDPGQRHKLWSMTRREFDQACGAFYEAVASGKIRHLGDPVLDEAVKACRRSKGLSDLWHWTRADTGADISPLVAASVAYHGLVEKKKKEASSKWLVL
jgi:phage terminase large subunit-like protein